MAVDDGSVDGAAKRRVDEVAVASFQVEGVDRDLWDDEDVEWLRETRDLVR